MNAQYLQSALKLAQRSRDPNTKVGALLRLQSGRIVTGHNRFARGLRETFDRLHDRNTKLQLMVHAEMCAILDAAQQGYKVDGATLYVAATDGTGMVWGGAPCTRCTVELIHAGVRRVVTYPGKPEDVPWKWREDTANARELLGEADVELIVLPRP